MEFHKEDSTLKNLKEGATATEVIKAIVEENVNIKFLTFASYLPKLNVSETEDLSLRSIGFHNSFREEFPLSRKEILGGKIQELIKNLPEGRALAVLSKTEVDGEICHLPMIDFCCGKSVENLKTLYEIISTGLFLLEGATFLDSGRSYHFYSTSLMGEEGWINRMGHCLLFTGYIDARWVGHRLIDGFGSLRISAGGIRQTVPKVLGDPYRRKA